jgi:hypothetical protein
MQGRFYPDVFLPNGFELSVPTPAEQIAIHTLYITDLLNGRFASGTRERIVEIINAMAQRDDLQAVLLAGTELPLLLCGATCNITLFDTTQAHVDAVIAQLLASIVLMNVASSSRFRFPFQSIECSGLTSRHQGDRTWSFATTPTRISR